MDRAYSPGRSAQAEDGEGFPRTRIIGVSTVGDLEPDWGGTCSPRNDGCYVVEGALDARYVGYNEAGVRSLVSRAVKEEMERDDDATRGYALAFVGAASEGEAALESTADASSFSKIIGAEAEPLPGGGSIITPVGATILGVLGLTLIVLIYAVFSSSDAPESIKDKYDGRRDRKRAKRRALCDVDEDRYSSSDPDDYCYDLESVAVEPDEQYEGEEGLEVMSVRSVAQGSRDSLRTRRASNVTGAGRRASPPSAPRAASPALTSLPEGEDDSDPGPGRVRAVDAGASVHTSASEGSGRSRRDDAEPSSRRRHTAAREGSRLVDRVPDLVPSDAAGGPKGSTPTSGGSAARQLPSISEAGMPPPMYDTPHRRARTEEYEV